ncbi:MAG: efflux RND transporter periplasmic adaptor subunit [Chitinophagales bacterium]|nr:efflux RND transporter periplasmic adaptor subunit [Chitinophagales bacterium]
MKKGKIILLLILIVAAAAVYYFYFRKDKEDRTVSFVTGKAEYGYIGLSVTATGTVQPVDTVTVGAQVSGVVQNVYVDFNDVVKAGQLIAKVDPSIIEQQLDQAKATLANAQSNLAYLQSNYDRQNQLYELGAISKADYQLALNQFNSAKASVSNATAQLNLAQRNLYYTNIYSPINGVVLNRNVSAGQTIASSFSAPTLFVIARDLTKMQVRADVDEADIGGVRSGQHVTFTVDAFPNDVFHGSVNQILLRPAVSANVVTYTTLIDVDNKSLKLKPGMTASINIYTQEDSNALLIPARAINFRPDTSVLKKYVFVKAKERLQETSNGDSTKGFREDNVKVITDGGDEEIRSSSVWMLKGDTLIEKKILTGIDDDVHVHVIKGLSAGDEVITNMMTGAVKADNSDNAQRSPFMPQMRRRTPSGNKNTGTQTQQSGQRKQQ